MNTAETIEQKIQNHPIILFMKGSPESPQCGFSARTVQLLQACEADFESVDVLDNPEIRQTLPLVSNWPTFPQLFVKGELIGGCDIVTAMYNSGELHSVLNDRS